jgi:NADH dehydrogenase
MLNIPESDNKRVVIVGCGFAGLTLAKKLKNAGFQVVILDKHNYHQFPPLFYQVASAGLEETSILFPLRKIFHNYKNYHIRKAEMQSVDVSDNNLITTQGSIKYDFLVLAHGATNSYFGSVQMQQNSKGMKTIAEVLDLRNSLLMNFENALTAQNEAERKMLLNIVIIGGGPSGVEIAGALAEMNKYVLPKDFPEFKDIRANIYLIEATDRVLNMMSEKSSSKAQEFLKNAGVQVMTNTKATGCDEQTVFTSSGINISTSMIIWTAGIKGNLVNGLNPDCLGTMATVGKHLAVVELPFIRFQGIFGWFVWMFIHLMSIVGVRNKLLIFINWAWKYFTYDQSTRLILRPKGYS